MGCQGIDYCTDILVRFNTEVAWPNPPDAGFSYASGSTPGMCNDITGIGIGGDWFTMHGDVGTNEAHPCRCTYHLKTNDYTLDAHFSGQFFAVTLYDAVLDLTWSGLTAFVHRESDHRWPVDWYIPASRWDVGQLISEGEGSAPYLDFAVPMIDENGENEFDLLFSRVVERIVECDGCGVEEADAGPVASATISNPGSGYVDGEHTGVAVAGGSGSGMEVDVTVINGGISQIDAISDRGEDYAIDDVDLTISLASGSGATLDVTNLVLLISSWAGSDLSGTSPNTTLPGRDKDGVLNGYDFAQNGGTVSASGSGIIWTSDAELATGTAGADRDFDTWHGFTLAIAYEIPDNASFNKSFLFTKGEDCFPGGIEQDVDDCDLEYGFSSNSIESHSQCRKNAVGNVIPSQVDADIGKVVYDNRNQCYLETAATVKGGTVQSTTGPDPITQVVVENMWEIPPATGRLRIENNAGTIRVMTYTAVSGANGTYTFTTSYGLIGGETFPAGKYANAAGYGKRWVVISHSSKSRGDVDDHRCALRTAISSASTYSSIELQDLFPNEHFDSWEDGLLTIDAIDTLETSNLVFDGVHDYKAITGATVSDGGSGYSADTDVPLGINTGSGFVDSGARVTTTVSGGEVTGVVITSGGSRIFQGSTLRIFDGSSFSTSSADVTADETATATPVANIVAGVAQTSVVIKGQSQNPPRAESGETGKLFLYSRPVYHYDVINESASAVDLRHYRGRREIVEYTAWSYDAEDDEYTYTVSWTPKFDYQSDVAFIGIDLDCYTVDLADPFVWTTPEAAASNPALPWSPTNDYDAGDACRFLGKSRGGLGNVLAAHYQNPPRFREVPTHYVYWYNDNGSGDRVTFPPGHGEFFLNNQGTSTPDEIGVGLLYELRWYKGCLPREVMSEIMADLQTDYPPPS